MEIITQPNALSMVGNINRLVLASITDVAFVLTCNGDTIVQHTYSPNDAGRIEIDLKNIIQPLLSFTLQDISTPWRQTDIVKEFQFSVAEINTDATLGTASTASFSVIRAGVDALAGNAAEFLAQNFLTWQPNVKPVTYYSPEFLTYYATGQATVQCKAYMQDGSTQQFLLAQIPDAQCWTIPVQYAIIAGKCNDMPMYYDVWVENSSDQRVTYVQRFVANDMRSEEEEWILFENSLGGIDCFRAYGDSHNTAEHTHNVAEIDEDFYEYRVDTTRKFQKNTGRLGRRERLWLLDFFPSLAKYVYVDSHIRRIVLVDSDVNYNAKELPTTYNFTYKYADARPYLNLPRVELPQTVLNIRVPDLGSFFIAPRLVEFPRAQLSGGALFPVQNPYSETWTVTTFAAILEHVVQALQTSNAQNGGGGIGHTHANISLLDGLYILDDYLTLYGDKIKAGYSDVAGDLAADSPAFSKVLRKDRNDSTPYSLGVGGSLDVGRDIVAHGNADFGGFAEGSAGAGIWKDAHDNWHIEGDYLHARHKLVAKEVQIEDAHHVGGQQLLTAASMTCDFIVEKEDAWRCFFLKKDPQGKEVRNKWRVMDQAYVCTFNLKVEDRHEEGDGDMVGNHYLWRLVTATSNEAGDTGTYVVDGEELDASLYHFIDLSKEDCADFSDAPWLGDEIVQLGYRGDDPDRQNATVMAGAGTGSPYVRLFKGITTYHLPKPEIQLKPGDNILTGVVNILPGSTLPSGGDVNEVLSNLVNGQMSMLEDIENLDTGNCNLLRNSGFTGDYESDDAQEDTSVSPQTQMYSPNLKHWEAENATVVADAESASGFSALLDEGELRQRVAEPLVPGNAYCVSIKAGGSRLNVSIGGCSNSLQLDESFSRKVLRVTCTDATDNLFVIEGKCKVAEVQLTRGNVPNADWMPSPNDNDKVMAHMQNLSYLTNAILNASTSIIGGLILTQMIRVGNYRDKVMERETGGMSGIYTSGQSPFLWGGGTMEQAFYTIGKYARDPSYQPTDKEVASMAKFVVTHGGRAILNDIVLRGYIYALGGKFKGTVEATDGVFNGKVYASEGSFTGEVNATSGLFKNIHSPNNSFEINENGDITIKGNFYNPLYIVDEGNYDSCVVETGKTGFGYFTQGHTLNFEETGLNVQFDYIQASSLLDVNLPVDEKYLGANVRIMNNSKTDSLAVIYQEPPPGGFGGSASSRGRIIPDNTYCIFTCIKDRRKTHGYRWVEIGNKEIG